MSLKTFTDAYIEAALWSSNDESNDAGGEPLDRNYGPEDIAPATLAKMEKDCASFYENWYPFWKDESGYDDAHAGHDFWLTRNGHGAGFWDRGIAKGKRLTLECKPYGSFDLYVGDDGKVHA